MVVLSRLCKLSEVTKSTVQKMPIEYDVKEDAFYKVGVADERKRMEEERQREKKLIEERKIFNY